MTGSMWICTARGNSSATSPRRPARAGSVTNTRSPRELFDAYLAESGHDDPAVAKLFAELYEQTQTVAAEES
jgi:hypothetical protein